MTVGPLPNDASEMAYTTVIRITIWRARANTLGLCTRVYIYIYRYSPRSRFVML